MRRICMFILMALLLHTPASSSAQLPPQIAIYPWYCVDANRVGRIDLSAAPVSDSWNAPPPIDAIGEPLPYPTRPADLIETELLTCRFPRETDPGVTFHLVNTVSGERQTAAPTDGNWGPTFFDVESGTYQVEIEVNGQTISSGEFGYEMEANPALNITVIAYLETMDWTPPSDDPEDIGEVSIIPFVCDGGEVRYRQSTYGVIVLQGPGGPYLHHRQLASQTPLATPDQMRSCARAERDDYQFALIPAGSDQSVDLYWTPDGRIVTDFLPMGEYEIVELVTGTSAGVIYVVAGQDIVFEAPAP